MRLSDRFDTRTSFIDMLISGQMNLFILLVMAIVMINPEREAGNVEVKAEMSMSVEWDPSLDCDVDTWVRGPDGKLVSYLSKDMGYMHLDRDDTGSANDTVNGVTAKLNVEYWTLRTSIPGEYTVSLYSYACRKDGIYVELKDIGELRVDVRLLKLNPALSVVVDTEAAFDHVYEEVHLFKFSLDADGTVTRTWREPTKLVNIDAKGVHP